MKLHLRIPPLALGTITFLIIYVTDRYIPLYSIHFRHQNSIASLISWTGLLIAISGVVAFKQSKTTVDPRYPQKASKLVIAGIYKYSRNPMYLGMLLALTGFVVFLGSLSGIFLLCMFVLYINKYQIIPEEILLNKKFGSDYRNYTKTVRRWL